MVCPMSAIEKALNAATALLTEDHFLVEAISAAKSGRVWFRPDYDRELVEVSVHLSKVAAQADEAACLCYVAGLHELSRLCERFAQRIALAKHTGTADVVAIPDLSRLTVAGRDALDAAEEIAAEQSRF